MNIKEYFTYKKILQSILVIMLGVFCYAFAGNIVSIDDDIIPLSSGNIEAMFYIENTQTGNITCIGDGLINTSNEISNNIELVKNSILSFPDYTIYLPNGYTVVWNSIENNNGRFSVLGYITSATDSSPSSTASFTNIEAMKRAALQEGQFAKTYYYQSEGDFGGALYQISRVPHYSHPNLSIKLYNGLYANIQITNGSINVASMGIFPNQDMSSLLYKLEKELQSNVSEFVFNNGTYYIADELLIGSFSYIGSSSTTWAVAPSFSRRTYRIIRADSKDWNNIPLNIHIESINFLYETHSDSPINNLELLLLAIAGSDNCNINNCTFTAKPAAQNGAYAKIDLLWFRDSSSKNIHISNSKFYNLTAAEHNTEHLIGGCFWYMGKDNEICENIIVDNCEFNTTLSDEAVCIWRGRFKNIIFNNCLFANDVHQCDGLVGMNNALFDSLKFNNCRFRSDVSTKKQLFFYNIHSTEYSDISVENCTFMNNNDNEESKVPGDGDINCYISIPFNESATWTLNVEDSQFNSLKNEYDIRSIVNLYRSPNVDCSLDSSNSINVETSSPHVSRNYLMGNYY